jgi:hypothetical protein
MPKPKIEVAMQTTAAWTTIFDGRTVDRGRPWIATGVDPADECREELAVIVEHRLSVAEGASS